MHGRDTESALTGKDQAMTRLAYLVAINRAERAGFRHFAAALRECYRRDFPSQ